MKPATKQQLFRPPNTKVRRSSSTLARRRTGVPPLHNVVPTDGQALCLASVKEKELVSTWNQQHQINQCEPDAPVSVGDCGGSLRSTKASYYRIRRWGHNVAIQDYVTPKQEGVVLLPYTHKSGSHLDLKKKKKSQVANSPIAPASSLTLHCTLSLAHVFPPSSTNRHSRHFFPVTHWLFYFYIIPDYWGPFNREISLTHTHTNTQKPFSLWHALNIVNGARFNKMGSNWSIECVTSVQHIP